MLRILGTTIIYLGLLGVLAYLAMLTVPKQIEFSIHQDISNQYAEADLHQIDISLDGRDVHLVGEVDNQDQVNRAMQIASSRPGVRVVKNDLIIAQVNNVQTLEDTITAKSTVANTTDAVIDQKINSPESQVATETANEESLSGADKDLPVTDQ